MRDTKISLLIFGFGLALGLVVVAAEVKWFERIASAAMALAIAAIPVGMLADLRRAITSRFGAAKRTRRGPVRRVRPRRAGRENRPR
jgi:hypothetical protein